MKIFSLFMVFFWTAMICLMSQAACAGDITFRAYLDRNVIYPGQSAQLSLEFQGTSGVKAPEVQAQSGLQIRYMGPSTSMTIVNGRMSSSVTHMYSIVPLRTGTFDVGPFSVDYEGTSYKADALHLQVVDNSSARAPGSSGRGAVNIKDRVFIALKTAKDRVYPNEKTTLTVKLYASGISIRDIAYPQLSHEGVSMENFDKPAQYKETVGGVIYNVIEFRTSIFAVSPGPVTLGPARIKANVVSRRRRSGRMHSPFDNGFFGRDPFGDFFGNYDTHPVALESEAAVLNVQHLPDKGRPGDFHGAIGSFSLDLEVTPAEVRAGDPVTMKMIVSGNGNFDTVQSPAPRQVKGFKSYSPQSKTEPGRKIFEQVLIPESTDIREVPPVSFSYFDPEQGKYMTLVKRGIPLKVTMPEKQEVLKVVESPSAGTGNIPQEKLGRDIIYIKEKPGTLRQRGRYLYHARWFIALQFLPMIAYAILSAVQRRRARIRNDSRYARRLRAPGKARKGMREAESLLRRHMAGEFYDTLFATMRSYLADRFHLPEGGLTADTAVAALKDRGVDTEVIDKLHRLLESCDAARYARSAGVEEGMAGGLDLLKQIIDYLERFRG